MPRATAARVCTRAVENVNTEICEAVLGLDGTEQGLIDRTLIDLDGTENKSRLGANAILAVSCAVRQGCRRGMLRCRSIATWAAQARCRCRCR